MLAFEGETLFSALKPKRISKVSVTGDSPSKAWTVSAEDIEIQQNSPQNGPFFQDCKTEADHESHLHSAPLNEKEIPLPCQPHPPSFDESKPGLAGADKTPLVNMLAPAVHCADQVCTHLALWQSQKSQPSTTSSMPGEAEPYSVTSKCIAEMLAVMIFVLVGSLQAVTTHDGVLHAALCHGAAIFVLVSCTMNISGGHVNPAVTVGLAAAGKIPPSEAVYYVISQLFGGFLGALVVRVLLPYDKYVLIQGGATLCAANTAWYQGFFAEALTTYFLVQTVLLTAVDSSTVLAPLAIGFTILMDILAVGGISGASMNPGRSLGPNIAATIFMKDKLSSTFWTYHWIYYVGPVVGALVAVGLYKLFFAKHERML